MAEKSEWYREYDLVKYRGQVDKARPAPHQQEAFEKLVSWYDEFKRPNGGVLVLPTGAGKTFVAERFLCAKPLSDGYKVLWLAHTHHLLEQAYVEFEKHAALIAEPKRELKTRVVSGVKYHFDVKDINGDEDVVVATIQTICRADRDRHPNFEKFIGSAGGKLFVVLDEAHHAPAPTYRKLLTNLRDKITYFRLLGLTATPTYYDEKKEGWLAKLFPQVIVFRKRPNELMAAGYLAKPVSEQHRTDFEPEWDRREYELWVRSNQDLPEEIITMLAEKQERNDFIIRTYLEDRGKYGKTLIFADRWFQCEYFSGKLKETGIRAGAVYSKVEDIGAPEARKPDKNAKNIAAFKAGELDVLINVRMLTEGTDVPDCKSVFLTRQTTSPVLLTQMVGRALRGPKFGGKDEAHLVFFIDNWQHLVNWAEYDQIAVGTADEAVPEYGKRPPVHLISIYLVQRLVAMMESGKGCADAPFITYLPVGWYRVSYQAAVEGSDDVESLDKLVMVYEGEKPAWDRLIEEIGKLELAKYGDPDLMFSPEVEKLVSDLKTGYLPDSEALGRDIAGDVFAVLRHMAQNEGDPPKFFAFEEREGHDVDIIAARAIEENWGPLTKRVQLKAEYDRKDRLWKVFYYRYDQFEHSLDLCINRRLNARELNADPTAYKPTYEKPEELPDREITEELRAQVKVRDNYMCLACFTGNKRVLQVDHVIPYRFGGAATVDNLQTLCRTCNGYKSDKSYDFKDNTTRLTEAPRKFLDIDFVPRRNRNVYEWARCLTRAVNFFYQCQAVVGVQVQQRGKNAGHWRIKLFDVNNPVWLEPFMPGVLNEIFSKRAEFGFRGPYSLEVIGAGYSRMYETGKK